MTRIQIKNGRDREDKKLFVPYVFFLSIFMSLPLADRKRERKRERERERERARCKKESYDNKIGRSTAKKESVKLLF